MSGLLEQMTALHFTLASVVLVSWLATAIALTSLARVRRNETYLQDSLNELQRHLAVSNSGLMGMGRKLLTIEKNLRPIARQKVDNKPASVSPIRSQARGEQRYEQAGQMLGQGMTNAQVSAATGLTQAEINLLAMLRQPLGQAG